MRQRRPHTVEKLVAAFVVPIAGWLPGRLGMGASPAGRQGVVREALRMPCIGSRSQRPAARRSARPHSWNRRDFQSSAALKKSRLKWTDETLDKWLTNTEELVPDNDMTFHVEKSEERSAIIAYLKSPGK
jgi:hypothetical protein